ncbi:MAG: hypothetical protein JNN15_20520, partial [Blastocatellia bacterium]|nr:hypothetical protein [Blastocatellia bacterium]
RNRCEKCKQETRLNRLKARIGSSGGSTPKSIKIRDIENSPSQKKPNILASKIADIKKQLSSINARNIATVANKKVVVTVSLVVSVIIAVLMVSVLIRNYNAKRVGIAKQDGVAKQELQVNKRKTGQEIMKLANQYEGASRKLKKQPQDHLSLLARGEAAEELNLPAKALEDYENYLKLPVDQASRSLIEKKVTKLQEAINSPAKVEATHYEKFNSFLNSYLLLLIEGKNTEAQQELKLTDSVATLMMKDSNEKVGIDQVEFYSKLSVDAAKELLEARLETEEVSKVIAIDHFQDSIDRLYKAKEAFVRHGAVADEQTVSFLLVKFLSKAGNLQQARVELNNQQNVAKEKSYLFNYAQQLLWDAQLNVLERKEQEAVRKLQECIEICQKIDAEKFSLYPLLLSSQIYVTAGFNERAFVESFQGLEGSFKYNLPAFTSQFLQTAGRAATGFDSPHLAIEYLERAVDVCEKNEFWVYGAVIKATLAAIIAKQEDTAKAIVLIEEAKTLDLAKVADPLARKQSLINIYSYEGKIYGLAKKYVLAEKAYRAFMLLSAELGYEDYLGVGQVRKGLGEALVEQGRKVEALEEFIKAQKEFEKIQLGLHPKNENRFLDYSFSEKDISELIKSVQH